MDLITTLAGGHPLTWALRSVERHGAPEAARKLGPSPYQPRVCACGLVAHADALAAMGHGECGGDVQLRCADCGDAFGLSVVALTAHIQRTHGRTVADNERTPK